MLLGIGRVWQITDDDDRDANGKQAVLNNNNPGSVPSMRLKFPRWASFQLPIEWEIGGDDDHDACPIWNSLPLYVFAC